MSFRARLLLAFLAATVAPLVLFAAGVRREIDQRLAVQDSARVAALSAAIERSIGDERASIAARLRRLAASLPDDERLRRSLVRDVAGDRGYALDYAGRAMATAGLEVLQLHDADGRIVSSGHFRNDFDRLAPELPAALASVRDGAALGRLRTPEGPVLALVGVDSVRMAGRVYTLVGGMLASDQVLGRAEGEGTLRVDLVTPDDAAPASDAGQVVREIELAYVDGTRAGLPNVSRARLRIVRQGDELAALQRGAARWLAAALALIVAGAVGLAAWLSARLSGPLARLALATRQVSLDGPDVELATGRDDEIGLLARRLSSMTRRLRAGAHQLRDAERRATVGDMARQVNHDIKNGLIPIRNVLRHLTQVQESAPGELSETFAARRATLESSVGYLDALARQYARLTPRSERRTIDVAAVASEVVGSAAAGGAPVQFRANGAMVRVQGDPLALRRVLDNLVRNGVESLTSPEGMVTMEVRSGRDGIEVLVSDTGRGMTEAEIERAFDDFHTTKPTGTGLGLSVVRRLASDLGGSVRIQSMPGKGTTATVTLPSMGAGGATETPGPPHRFPIPDSRFPTR